MEQSSILFAKFDCPGYHQKFSLLATAHDWETGLLKRAMAAAKFNVRVQCSSHCVCKSFGEIVMQLLFFGVTSTF